MTDKSDTKWTAKQLRYRDILADPTDSRTKEKIRKELGVTRQTLWNWERLPGFKGSVRERMEELSAGGTPAVVKALHRKATLGMDVQAMRLWLQWQGMLIEKGELKHEVVGGKIEFNVIDDAKERE